MDFVSQRVVDGVTVTALRDPADPRKEYLAWSDKIVPVVLRDCWTDAGVREVMRANHS